MTFLKNLGLEAIKFISIALAVISGGAPALEQAIPGSAGVITTTENDLTEIENIITGAESGVANAQAKGLVAAGQAGPLKLALATPAVAGVIGRRAVAQGVKFSSASAFEAAATAQVNASVAKLNAQKGTAKTAAVV